MKKEYMSPELTLLELKSPVIMDVVTDGETTKSWGDEFDEQGN